MKSWAIGVLLVLFGIAAYYYFIVHQPAETIPVLSTTAPAVVPAPEPKPAPAPAPAESETSESLVEVEAPPVEEIPLPMLMESDPVVLETLGGMIGEPAVTRYLVTDNFISRIVATIDTLGSSRVPGVVQVVQGPATSFEANVSFQPETPTYNEEGDPVPQFVIDPANYQRYTPYVELLEAVDSAELVEYYRDHYPLFEEAFHQMGHAGGDFNERLVDIIDELLATPEVADPVHLVKPEAFFLFTDPELESLTAGQKILLRMGSANAARVKLKLSEIRSAL